MVRSKVCVNMDRVRHMVRSKVCVNMDRVRHMVRSKVYKHGPS